MVRAEYKNRVILEIHDVLDEKGNKMGEWYIHIDRADLTKLIPQIKADAEDKMGYKKYLDLLRKEGFDV